jgi:hypothetical protein
MMPIITLNPALTALMDFSHNEKGHLSVALPATCELSYLRSFGDSLATKEDAVVTRDYLNALCLGLLLIRDTFDLTGLDSLKRGLIASLDRLCLLGSMRAFREIDLYATLSRVDEEKDVGIVYTACATTSKCRIQFLVANVLHEARIDSSHRIASVLVCGFV